VVNDAFLNYSRAQGNDLSTPVPAHSFPGLQAGDHWCVCAARWLEAYEDGMAPPVRLESSALATLQDDLLDPVVSQRGVWLAMPLPALYSPNLLRHLKGWVWAPAPGSRCMKNLTD
jgi:hypothetical protein